MFSGKHFLKRSEALTSSITVIKGITARTVDKFARLGVKTVRDLLYFVPSRYIDYSQQKLVAQVESDKEQTVIVAVWQSRIVNLGGRRGTEVIVGDKTGNMRAVWFNQPYLAGKFRVNDRIVLSGRVNVFRGQKVFESPEWELIGKGELIHTARLVPVYPLTQGLYLRRVRNWAKEVVDGWAWQLEEILPAEVKSRHWLLSLPEAIAQVHFPDNQQKANQARERLAFDELFIFQLGMLLRKRDFQEERWNSALRVDRKIIEKFMSCLPFQLTQAQCRVLQEILSDLGDTKPMLRLLQGEVGSGKTVIAALSLLLAVADGYQGALMAPTEVLAEQHFGSICSFLSPGARRSACSEDDNGAIISYEGFLSRPVTVALLVGGGSVKQKEYLCDKIRRGEVDIIIGTHALIQKRVEFSRLGLVVIDEQHRFGVMQRSALRQKGFNPHMLMMTATPIPRTMALTLYGDMDISVIDELPPGRQTVRTKWLKPEYREKIYDFIRHKVENGGQSFIIYPLIEESEVLEARAAVAEYEQLSQKVFPEFRLGLLHGRMPAADKEMVMRSFRDGEIDILVSTSVVEVGIDVPAATVMLVEGADRFGLSQLHQLRGRVGRGKEQSFCILVPESFSIEVRRRLALLEKVHDGFFLAEEDLKLRGPGDFFGVQQSGLLDFRVARLSDFSLIERTRKEAIALLSTDAGLEREEHAVLRKRVEQLWAGETDWS